MDNTKLITEVKARIIKIEDAVNYIEIFTRFTNNYTFCRLPIMFSIHFC